MEEPGRLQSMGSLLVRHDWAISLSLFTFMHRRRKWQPTQCSCLENPRDGGAWWAAVYGVAQSRTRLKWLSSSMGILSMLWKPICQFVAPLDHLPFPCASPLHLLSHHLLFISIITRMCIRTSYAIITFESCGGYQTLTNFLTLYLRKWKLKRLCDLLQVIWREAWAHLKLDSKPSVSLCRVFPIHHSASGIFQLTSSYKSCDVVNEWTFSE